MVEPEGINHKLNNIFTRLAINIVFEHSRIIIFLEIDQTIQIYKTNDKFIEYLYWYRIPSIPHHIQAIPQVWQGNVSVNPCLRKKQSVISSSYLILE